MKKTLSYILPAIVGFFAVIPVIDFRLVVPPQWWPFTLTLTGLAGMYILFMQRVTITIKAVSLCGLINCFFSNVPFLSFNAYASVVACCYFYIGVTRMDSWAPMFKMLKALLLLNFLLIGAQFFTHDQMLNFGLEEISTFGVVGHHMQEASFFIILTALLIQIHPMFFLPAIIVALFCNSVWALVCVGVGVWICYPSKYWKMAAGILFCGGIILAGTSGKFEANLIAESGRLNIWIQSIEIANIRAWEGWGIGTYKVLFPAMAKFQLEGIPWKTAHNDWLQFLFEIGRIMFGFLILRVVCLGDQLRRFYLKTGNPGILAGYAMIVCNMLVHFPTRMIQCVLLILTFLAYCELKLNRCTIKML